MRGWASLVASSRAKHIELIGAVDDGETVDTPRVFILYGRPADRLMLLGGYFAHVIDREVEVHSRVPLNRGPETEEYWAMVLRVTDAGIIVIYENGVMLITEDLSLKWHIHKFINDFFVQFDGDDLLFFNELSGNWRLSRATGLRL